MVQCSFRILAMVFQVFQKRLQMNPANVKFIIQGACVLHNYMRDKAPGGRLEVDDCVDFPEGDCLLNLPPIRRRPNTARKEFRERFTHYFSSPAGQVQWQEAVLNKGIATD